VGYRWAGRLFVSLVAPRATTASSESCGACKPEVTGNSRCEPGLPICCVRAHFSVPSLLLPAPSCQLHTHAAAISALCPLCPRPTLWWIQRCSIDYLHALAMPCVCPAKTPGCDVFAAGLSLACPASESLAHASSMSRCLSFGRGPRALFVLALKHP
jgi:hypothetical protein